MERNLQFLSSSEDTVNNASHLFKNSQLLLSGGLTFLNDSHYNYYDHHDDSTTTANKEENKTIVKSSSAKDLQNVNKCYKPRTDFSSIESLSTSACVNNKPSVIKYSNGFNVEDDVSFYHQQDCIMDVQKEVPLLKSHSRGRPSATSIKLLRQRSLEKPERHVCFDCSRSFPRKKSLDTHMLTHSNMKPYACDFPGCKKRFKQSGQLKTHFRLHTGEKPFQCSFPTCNISFTHANRKCPHHTNYSLKRVSDSGFTHFNNDTFLNNDNEIDIQIKKWLDDKVLEKLSTTDQLNSPPTNSVLNSIGNDMQKIIEEKRMRLLSAVALVELRDKTFEGKENV